MKEHRPRIVIAGTGSGVGKTTITLGLMAAFRRRNMTVQGFKTGPDYIDPTYHTAVTGRSSRNLDVWMMPRNRVREIFLRGSEGADLSIVEGVMGLYDGKDPLSDTGSTADIAILLQSPVVLVVDIHSMARSVAAIVMGFQQLNPEVAIRGVIVNKAGSEGHYRLAKAAIEQECGIPVFGWLPRDAELNIPERHLGLIPAVERGELQPLFEQLADVIEQGVDLDALISVADEAPALAWPEERLFVPVAASEGRRPVIAVARDAAFHFYYPENLELLTLAGADLRFFSPLAGEPVPEEADGLMIGGGFPEEFVSELAQEEDVKDSIRRKIAEGLPTFAECGGYMYLCEAIIDRAGREHPMVGVIPAKVTMRDRLAALGYREVTALSDSVLLEKGEKARGHEFHYSALTPETEDYPRAYACEGRFGTRLEGYVKGNVLAGYVHLHFASHPEMVRRWLLICREYGKRRDRV
ncbi:cobyrinate a,c-diamide synthase [Polycladomyces subterraneus]|uniref:Cobyrinate a,c-diamide synthase n=1 Tax=Polycladomyces subterraneus TaxID=1016997 RepID=A0ABT8IP79_9BACL|nr:cobyrinate a,c-diamide synthase [Polycladomyces subterraneus]MDN4594552.1 cobyrinate a,c-diamide synthase [Polycladomyces subterraneus]